MGVSLEGSSSTTIMQTCMAECTKMSNSSMDIKCSVLKFKTADIRVLINEGEKETESNQQIYVICVGVRERCAWVNKLN